MRRLLRQFFLLGGILCVLWLFGFGLFLGFIEQQRLRLTTPWVEHLDTLVVFTGGAGRVDKGLLYLQQYPNLDVLISGVHPKVSLVDLLGGRTFDGAQLERLHLDHQALTTRENVKQTKAWLGAREVKEVGLITSDYHVLRSLYLFKVYAPHIKVTVLPVRSDPPFDFLWREYHKLLVAPLLK